MYSKEAARSDLSLKSFFDALSFRRSFYRNHPTYFYSDGLICFTGSQGSGKTLTAVKYVCKLMEMYPKLKLCTNVDIADYPVVSPAEFIKDFYCLKVFEDFDILSDEAKKKIYNDYLAFNRVFRFNGPDDLKRYSNLEEGVVFLIDEIQLYFNSMDSKNISMEVMTEISQQRKQRKHIVATSQVFGRMAKPLREQFNTVVKCRCFLSCFQYNVYVRQEDVEMDNDSAHFKGKADHVQFFFHKAHDYQNYDTYNKVLSLSPVGKGGNFYDCTDSAGSNASNN